jgi:hypothetical protein
LLSEAILEKSSHVAASFRKLKIIGDMGSHSDEVEITREHMLDAYELFEDCLRHVYGEDERERINQLRARLEELKR